MMMVLVLVYKAAPPLEIATIIRLPPAITVPATAEPLVVPIQHIVTIIRALPATMAHAPAHRAVPVPQHVTIIRVQAVMTVLVQV